MRLLRRMAGCTTVLALLAALATPATPAGALLGLPLPVALPGSGEPIELGHLPECLEAVPAALSLPAPGRDVVRLDVRVLLDGVSPARGQEVFETARGAYAPLSIALTATFEQVSFTGASAGGLLEQAKGRFGGARPAGTDIVYVLTAKDIEDQAQDSVAGLADCIGGVAFADRAFAVGEVFDPDTSALGSIVLARQLTARVAAHEIGHLMGAHHHYANCVEGILSGLGQGELSPCTLMFNAADVASLEFSTLNGLVVRGHAEAYARP